MAQYAMSNPAFATGNDAMDQGLGSLASAFFPDPSKVASAGYYGAKTRETLIDAQQKQGQLDARGQLQTMVGAINNGALPNLHPGSVTDPDGGQKQSGPAAADGSPAMPTITVPQIMERAAAAGYDSANAGHIASSIVAQMYARGVIDKNTYVTMMTGVGNAAPLTAQTEITKQGMVTDEQRRQFDQTPMDVTDPTTGIKSQITRGQFNAAPKGTYLAADESTPVQVTTGPGAMPTWGRRATAGGQIVGDQDTYKQGQTPQEYTDTTDPTKPVVRLGPRADVLPQRPAAPSEGALVSTAPTPGAPPVLTPKINATGQIAGDQLLTRDLSHGTIVIDPKNPARLGMAPLSQVFTQGLNVPPTGLDQQQGIGAANLAGFRFDALDPNATPEQKAAVSNQSIAETKLATTPPKEMTPEESNAFNQLIEQETDRRFRPSGRAGETNDTAVLAPAERQALVDRANKLRASGSLVFRDNSQASIAEAFNQLQAEGVIPKTVNRTRGIVQRAGENITGQFQDSRVVTRNVTNKQGVSHPQTYLEIGKPAPSVAGTISDATKPSAKPPPGAIGPAQPGAVDGTVATNNASGQKAVVRGGWLFPVQ